MGGGYPARRRSGLRRRGVRSRGLFRVFRSPPVALFLPSPRVPVRLWGRFPLPVSRRPSVAVGQKPPNAPPSAPRLPAERRPRCPRAARRTPHALGRTPRAHRAASRPAPLAHARGGNPTAQSPHPASNSRQSALLCRGKFSQIVCTKKLKTSPLPPHTHPPPIWFPFGKFVPLPTVQKVCTLVT